MFPEHTALAYREAAKQGADLIECDLAITKVNLTWIAGIIRIVSGPEIHLRARALPQLDNQRGQQGRVCFEAHHLQHGRRRPPGRLE